MRWLAGVLVGVSAVVATAAFGDVSGIEVEERVDVLGGRPFGDVGAYERLSGTIRFAWDPANPANARVTDIELAPTNEGGLVEAHADFMVLQPKDPEKRSGVALLEVSNRGGKASLLYFNEGAMSRVPAEEAHFGDGLLMELGLTVIWVGWQWDVPPLPGLLAFTEPVATDGGDTIYGYARSDWVVPERMQYLPLGHRGHQPYMLARPSDEGNVLTVRDGRDAPRRVIPRDEWSFAKETENGPVPAPDSIYYEPGFEPGKIYELVYHTRRAAVVGLGLAAVRDTIAYAKHDESCPFPVEQGVAFGVSQTGRFLRQFLYQDFNEDEEGRIAFDGMLIHTAGAGRGSFNHRFAQPSRDAHRYSAFFYPTDIFPFASRELTDPVTGRTDGLLADVDAEHRPKIMYTNTGYEYWGRAASLIHTTPDGSADVEPLENERIYHLASGQHFVSRIPNYGPIAPGVRAWFGNPLDFMPAERALLTALVAWVKDGTEPPASRYPTLESGTLTPIEQLRFPTIPGVETPSVAHVAYRVDYGDRWDEGIIDKQPPELGKPFPVFVPQVDEFGNELGGVPSIEIMAPIATYTGWALRKPEPPEDELRDFIGMISPLPRVREGERLSTDTRPAVEVMYGGRGDYMMQVRAAAADLVAQGFLLERDVDRVVEHAGELWDWVMELD